MCQVILTFLSSSLYNACLETLVMTIGKGVAAYALIAYKYNMLS